MRLLRFLKDGQWLPLYLGQLKNRLRKDLNLSDLMSVEEARKNLELVGEVETHHHDTRYKQMIDQAKQEVYKKVDDIKIQMDQLKVELDEIKTINNTIKNNKMDNRRLVVGPAFSGSPREGDVWLNTSAGDHIVRAYHNGAWILYSGVWEE